jgi:WD40 repeat protein
VATVAGSMNSDIGEVAFSPRGNLLAVGDCSGGVVLWDVATGRQTGAINARPPGAREHEGVSGSPVIYGLQFSPDGRTLVVFPSIEGRLRAWEVATRREAEPWSLPHDFGVSDFLPHDFGVSDLWLGPGGGPLALGFVVDSKEGLVGDEPARLILWDVVGKRALWARSPTSPFATATFSGDGRTVALLDPPRSKPNWTARHVLLLDRMTGRIDATYVSPDDITCAVWSPTGGLLACGSAPEAIRIVDGRTGRALAGLRLHNEGGVEELAFSRDGQLLAAVGSDGRVMVWVVDDILRSPGKARKPAS